MHNYRSRSLFPSTLRRTDQAHSPFIFAKFNMEEKRSQLFPDRRRIPGRKAKVMLGLAVFFQIFGCYKIMEIKNYFRKKDMEMKKMQRKAAPFLQAVSDIRYCAGEERRKIIINELFAEKGAEYIKKITSPFHQKDIWAPFHFKYPYMYNRTYRNPRSYTSTAYGHYQSNHDMYNI